MPFSSWFSSPTTGGLKTQSICISSSTITWCFSLPSSRYIEPAASGYSLSLVRSRRVPLPRVSQTASMWLA